MRPLEAHKSDWQLYYGNTYMLVDGSVNLISVSPTDNEDRYRTTLRGKRSLTAVWRQLDPALIEPWWPRAGAYNFSTGAVYLGREARRSMKKSAQAPDHYKIMYGIPTRYPLWEVAKGPRYIPFADALELIKTGVKGSVAVSQSLILALSHNAKDISVVYRGQPAGDIKDGRFIPLFEGMPMCKRAMIVLHEEGIQCT